MKTIILAILAVCLRIVHGSDFSHAELSHTLVTAVKANDHSKVEEILRPIHSLSRNAVVNGRFKGKMLLHVAAKMGSAAMVELLLAYGANVNARTARHMETALHVARNPETVKSLLRNGANIFAQNRYQETPLHSAACRGSVPAATLLVAAFQSRFSVQVSAWIASLRTFSDWEWDSFIDAESDEDTTPLHYAVIYGHCEMVEFLLKYGADMSAVHADKTTALHHAAQKGHLQIATLLLNELASLDISAQEKSKFVNAKDIAKKTALHYAAFKGHTELSEKLLGNGANVNIIDNKQRTPLHLAAQCGHLSMVKLLVSAKAQLDRLDEGGQTPLHLAALNKHWEIVVHLCNQKAETAAASHNKDSERPLLAMLRFQNGLSVQTLRPADYEILGSHGETLLHVAAKYGITALIPEFVTQISPSGRDKKQQTPAHYAARAGHVDTLGMLIEMGGLPQSSDWMRALVLAGENGHVAVVDYLLSHGKSHLEKSKKARCTL